MNFDIPVREEIMILANALTDEQRKAIFAKMGGGGSGGANGTPVYTMASPTGTVGGTAPRMQYGGPLTVSSISEIPQETPNYRMGDMKLADGTVIPGDKLKDYLGAAYNEQSGVINTGLLSEAQKRQMGIIKDPMAGAQAVAIQGTPPGAMATPSQRVQQDLGGGTGASVMLPASSVPVQQTSPVGVPLLPSTATAAPAQPAAPVGDSGGSAANAVSIAEAINRIDLSGAIGGPTAEDIAGTNLKAFQDALALVHW